MLPALLALILPAAGPSPVACAAPAPRLRVLVRIDSSAPGKAWIPDVIDEVRRIWRPYLDIDFADAATGSALTAPVDIRPGPGGYDDELRLSITDRLQARGPSGLSNRAALGWIEFVAGRPESTVTVSVAAVKDLMSRGRWLGHQIGDLPPHLQRQFVAHALGRGAAHEIGHYLLRSSAHAPDGLMRQRMTVPEIMDQGLALFRLRANEVSLLAGRASPVLASTAINAGEQPAACG